jgi:hypothetical protein
LDSAFQSYASQGITDIVVDLRYNGGGDVNTAEHLVNLIAPSSANGKVMHTDYYNQMMQNGQATMLSNVPIDYTNPSEGYLSQINFSPSAQTFNISKAGNVTGLTKVYFIVSSGTASASEMVINCLSPYMSETQLSACFSDSSSFTYGKPVAFFEIRIGQFSMFTPNDQMDNANGYGSYYQGLQSNFQANITDYYTGNNQVNRIDFDDVTHDFGDPMEKPLSDMIYAIAGVNTLASSSQTSSGLRSMSTGLTNARVKRMGNFSKIPGIMVGKPKQVFKQ